jgi:hypothetical protein
MVVRDRTGPSKIKWAVILTYPHFALQGGDLDFNGVANTPTSKNDHFTCGHSPGVAVLHLGSHWHSALKISECVLLASSSCGLLNPLPRTSDLFSLTTLCPPLDRGERWNLIMWCRSSQRRGKKTVSTPKCLAKADS